MKDFDQFQQPDFTTDYVGNGVRYKLPNRQFGGIRHLGWFVVLFGTVVILFSFGWMSTSADGLPDKVKQGGIDAWMSVIFTGIGLFILCQGLMLIHGGLGVIRNRTYCVIDVRDGKITTSERFLPIRFRRTGKAADIKRLRIAAASEAMQEKTTSSQNTTVWFGNFDNALLAETDSKRNFLVAVGYPRELLVRLAEELAPRLEADMSVSSTTIEREPSDITSRDHEPRDIEVVEGLEGRDYEPFVPDQPADSIAVVSRRPDGITIEIPPVGIWKGSKGLIFFALIWNAFISIFIVVGVLAAAGNIKMEGDGPPWMMLLIMIPFVAVGAGITVAAINMGRRRATIATADDLVMVVRESIFGKSTREWSVDQIKEIQCGNSGMEVNNVPVKELQIIAANGTKFGCLSQLENADLYWLAGELKRALDLNRSISNEDGATPSDVR